MGVISEAQSQHVNHFLTPECLEYLRQFLGYHPSTFENHFLKGILLRERNTYTEKEKRILSLLGSHLDTIPMIWRYNLDDPKFGRYMKYVADFLQESDRRTDYVSIDNFELE